MKNYNVIDNFLSYNEYEYIMKYTILNSHFPMFLQHDISYSSAKDGVFLTHIFYRDGKESDTFKILSPILNKINYNKLLRVQLNFYPKTFFVRTLPWHIDFKFPHKGFLYYLNSNNGSTVVKDGTFARKIKSIKNRALFFDSSEEHTCTTCNNREYRSNIIVNYL